MAEGTAGELPLFSPGEMVMVVMVLERGAPPRFLIASVFLGPLTKPPDSLWTPEDVFLSQRQLIADVVWCCIGRLASSFCFAFPSSSSPPFLPSFVENDKLWTDRMSHLLLILSLILLLLVFSDPRRLQHDFDVMWFGSEYFYFCSWTIADLLLWEQMRKKTPTYLHRKRAYKLCDLLTKIRHKWPSLWRGKVVWLGSGELRFQGFFNSLLSSQGNHNSLTCSTLCKCTQMSYIMTFGCKYIIYIYIYILYMKAFTKWLKGGFHAKKGWNLTLNLKKLISSCLSVCLWLCKNAKWSAANDVGWIFPYPPRTPN